MGRFCPIAAASIAFVLQGCHHEGTSFVETKSILVPTQNLLVKSNRHHRSDFGPLVSKDFTRPNLALITRQTTDRVISSSRVDDSEVAGIDDGLLDSAANRPIPHVPAPKARRKLALISRQTTDRVVKNSGVDDSEVAGIDEGLLNSAEDERHDWLAKKRKSTLAALQQRESSGNGRHAKASSSSDDDEAPLVPNSRGKAGAQRSSRPRGGTSWFSLVQRNAQEQDYLHHALSRMIHTDDPDEIDAIAASAWEHVGGWTHANPGVFGMV